MEICVPENPPLELPPTSLLYSGVAGLALADRHSSKERESAFPTLTRTHELLLSSMFYLSPRCSELVTRLDCSASYRLGDVIIDFFGAEPAIPQLEVDRRTVAGLD